MVCSIFITRYYYYAYIYNIIKDITNMYSIQLYILNIMFICIHNYLFTVLIINN